MQIAILLNKKSSKIDESHLKIAWDETKRQIRQKKNIERRDRKMKNEKKSNKNSK